MEKTAPKKLGRPSTYDPAIVEPILDRISAGETLTAICREVGAPSLFTVYGWLHRNEDFAQAYARAQEERAETLADEIALIADEAVNATTPEEIQAAKLRVDARKWTASKLKPKRFGDRVTNEHTGADGGPIQHQAVERRIVDPKAA